MTVTINSSEVEEIEVSTTEKQMTIRIEVIDGVEIFLRPGQALQLLDGLTREIPKLNSWLYGNDSPVALRLDAMRDAVPVRS